MTAWKIKDWGARDGLFEVAQSRKYKRISWFAFPINLDGRGYAACMASEEGQAAYGIFCALCQVAGSLPVRGVLIDHDGAVKTRDLAVITRVPLVNMEAAIAFLSAPEIGWLQEVAPSTAERIARAIRSERARSKKPKHSESELEREAATEQELDKSLLAKQGDSHGQGGSAAAAGRSAAECGEVEAVLRRFWKNTDTIRSLVHNRHASMERVAWLVHRVGTERPTKVCGFIRKGIVEGWDIDQAWLARWRGLGGAA